MKLKPKICSDPKYLAWVSWTLLANNPINSTSYLVFCLIDMVIIMFYSFNLIQRVHFANFDYSAITDALGYVDSTNLQMFNLTSKVYEADPDFKAGGIQLTFLRQIDYYLNSLVRENSELLLMLTIGIMGFCMLIFGLIMLMSTFIKNHQDLEKPNFLKRVFCLILVSLLTFLHMPLFDVIIRTIIATHVEELSLSIMIIRYIICSFSILIFAGLMLFLVRIFNVCVPTELIPWCAPISTISFLNLIIKAALVICNAFDIAGDFALVEIVIFFFLQGFQACYRILFAPNYVKEIDLFVKTKDFAVCLIFFIGIICTCLGDKSNYDLIYFIIFIPIVTIGWILFEQYRKQTILLKVKNKELKLEIENEYALYVLMTLVRDSQAETVDSQKVFGQLMDLIITHIEECHDELCICSEMESFYELLRLKQLHNQEVFPLMRSERRRYKKIIDDQGLVGTVSNITDVTLKLNSTESTMSKGNNDNSGSEMLGRHDENSVEGIKESNNSKLDENLTTAQQVAKKKRSSTVYKINIDETKHRFLSELLYLFYFEMIQKFPDSFKIQLLSNYFALLYKRKEMLCVFQMRSFNKAKLSKLDQCCHQINEQYLLWEISKIQKANLHSAKDSYDGNFNGDYFINMNSLYKEFNITIEALSQSVVNFWKIFERPAIDVEVTYKIGTQISRNIQKVFRVFNQLDTLKITKDYQMYFQFAIVQLHILNDPMAYELYIGKMKSILEINKVYQKNFSQSSANNTDQANFIIVDANGAKFGQVIQINNGLRMLLGWDEEDVKRNKIESFMPMLIREKHPEFMNRYNKTGQSYIINNKTTMFIKKANGYVIPVELYIKFHYSVDYQYTFLAIVRPFYELAPFSNGVKYNLNQLLFLIVDNDDDGRITEFSESCAKLLASYGFNKDLDQNSIIRTIKDIVIDFDYSTFRKSRQNRYSTNEIYENLHKLDLNQFSDSNSLTHEHNKKTGNLLTSLLQNNGGFVNARTRVFEERYSGGVLDLNIFCFAFINENENGGSIIQVSSGNKLPGQMTSNVTNFKEAVVKNGHEDDEHLNEILERGDESMSATGSSSSMKDSTASMAEFRNFHSFTEQTTPKSLTQIMKMIVALYFIMIIIASVNLGINITRQMQSEQDVHTVRQAFDRMNWVSMNQLIVRVLLNIANDYEPDSSILLDNRFKEYSALQDIRVSQLKNTQSHLQQSKFTTSSEFEKFKSDKIVPLYYLSESNQPYIKYESLNVAFNLYIAKLTEMNSFKKKDLAGNLSIQTLKSNMSRKYKPTYIEQSLYFIVQNGNKELRQFAIDASYMYARESEIHAEQNIVQTKITAIISIVVIIIIGLVIAPILTKAEIRKYKALLYFLKIPRDKMPDLIKNCEYCLNMNDEERYFQILLDYEQFLGIKLANQQVEQLRQARDEAQNIELQASTKIDNSSGDRSSAYYSSQGDGQSQQKRGNGSVSRQTLGEEAVNEGGSFLGSIDSGFPATNSVSNGRLDSKLYKSDSKKETRFSKALANAIAEQDGEDEEHDDANQDKREETENANKFNLANLNIKQNISNDKKKVKQNSEEDEDQEYQDEEESHEKSQNELDNELQEHNEVLAKIKMINNSAYKRRSVMIFSSLTIILLLSTYFIIAYFLAMKTFQTAAEVIVSLESIFYKGSCFDSTMNFLRESEIRNESMVIKTTVLANDGNDNNILQATDYYLDFCFQKEAAYNKLRISLPKYFQKAESYINEMESSNMCEHIYIKEFGYLKELCKQSLNGILNKGLTNAFYHMFTQILKTNLNFISLGTTGRRDINVLTDMILDTQLVQIIDMKAQVLDPALNQLKQICMESVISYIQGLLNDFITAFVVFTALLTVSVLILIFIGFRILRKSMWDTNIILKIIPFETLPKEDRIEIKDFFNS